METDPASLDPEEKMNKYYSLFAVAFGVLSFCAALIPVCGGSIAAMGIVMGFLGRRGENKTMANAGIAISILGALTSITYMIVLTLASAPN